MDKRCPSCGADLSRVAGRDEDPLIGRVAGRYRIEALIGIFSPDVDGELGHAGAAAEPAPRAPAPLPAPAGAGSP